MANKKIGSAEKGAGFVYKNILKIKVKEIKSIIWYN